MDFIIQNLVIWMLCNYTTIEYSKSVDSIIKFNLIQTYMKKIVSILYENEEISKILIIQSL